MVQKTSNEKNGNTEYVGMFRIKKTNLQSTPMTRTLSSSPSSINQSLGQQYE